MAKCGAKMIFGILFGAIIVSSTATNCTFPTSLEGTWLSSSHGTWVASSTHIYGMNFKLFSTTTGPSGQNFTFICRESREDNIYVIESVTPYEIFVGIFNKLRTCIDLREISSAKFVYYIVKVPYGNGDILTTNDTYEGICDSSEYNASYAHHVVLKNGSESDGFILCPPSIYGTYSYNDSCTDLMYNTTNVNVCTTRQQIVFNYNACSTPLMYSQEGILNCVYYITNGSVSYLTVYNSDSTTPNEAIYYRFSCIVLEEITNIVYLTVNPKGCAASQNTTFVSTGQQMVWRPYELCPIQLEEKQQDLIWIAIVVGIVVGLVVLIIIIFVIVCCIRRIQKRKVDEEQPIIEETSADESSIEKDDGNEERKSVDSGISEPITTGRNKEERNTVGEVYIDDNSRPTTRKEISRMSDLPPITLPQVGTYMGMMKNRPAKQRKDPKAVDYGTQESETSKESLSELKAEENVQNEYADKRLRKKTHLILRTIGEHRNVVDGESSNSESDGSSEHDNEQKGDEDASQKSRGESGRTVSDSDDENLTPEERILKMIRKKDEETYQPKGSLTTTLISREDEEKKRQSKGKDKKKKLRKLRKKKLKYKISKGVEEEEGGQEGDGSESGSFDSEEEGHRIGGAVIAPFTKQYKYKKHIEHVLEEEHTLSDEDNRDKANNFNDLDTLSPSATSVHLLGEQEGIGPDSIGKKPGSDVDGDSDVSHMEDTTKRQSNSDIDETVKEKEKHDGTHRKEQSKGKWDDDEAGTHQVSVKDKTQLSRELQGSDSMNIMDPSKNEVTLIYVKELRQGKKKDRKKTMEAGEEPYESFSTETDSGVEDEGEAYVDVQLTKDQQEFIYKSLHDEHGNLRPVFEMNEEGKIIRKSDGTVVFDPHTGKVRIRKQIGNIFSIPRLKRNKNGRFIGGYHDDPFGPTKQKEAEAELAALDDSMDNNSISGKRSSSSRQSSIAQSARNPKKEDTIRTKTVAFDVYDEVEVVPMDNSELSELKRKGRRDITSAIRNKLRDRLFRRRKKKGVATPNDLPMSWKTKKAWMQSNSITMQEKIESGEDHGTGGGNIQLKPRVTMHGNNGPQWSTSTPLRSLGRPGAVPYNRSVGGGSVDPKYQRMFQQGLETDKKVMYSLNEKYMDNMRTGLYTNNDGQYHVAGEMKDLNKNDQTGGMGSDNSLLQDKEGYQDIDSPMVRRTGLNSTRLYDDYRLRILLEELFRDKKYFDHLIETTDPKSEVLMLTKDKAEYGREFLLERAEFWEERGPIPPRPPLTQYGFSMSRAHTSLQEDINSTSTITPNLRSHTMPVNLPGFVIHEKQSSNENIQGTEYVGKNEHESYV